MPKWKTLQSMQQFQPSALTALGQQKKRPKKAVQTAQTVGRKRHSPKAPRFVQGFLVSTLGEKVSAKLAGSTLSQFKDNY